MNFRDDFLNVCISDYVKGKPKGDDFDWRAFNASFKPASLTARQLAYQVYQGHSFTPYFKGRRKKENFISAWHIALDFDTEDERSSLDYLSQQDLINWFASFGYTSPSHTPEKPKARIVFIFPADSVIDSVERYEKLYKALLWFFPWADQSAKDGLRLFFGSPNCEVWANWSALPHQAQDTIIEQYEAHIETTKPKAPQAVVVSGGNHAKYCQAAVDRECDNVRQAGSGEGHPTLFRAAASLGGLVNATWCSLDRGQVVTVLTGAMLTRGTKKTKEEVERVINQAIDRAEARKEPVIAVPGGDSLLPYN